MARFFINRPIVAIVISIVTVLGGLIALFGLPIEQFPDIVPPLIEIQTSSPGADAQTIEQSVATPIKQQMNGVEDMLYLQSVNGLSAVETGIRFLALSVTIAVGSLISPRLAQRAGRGFARISAAGTVAASLGLFGLLRLHAGSGYGTYWWALVLLGLGIAFAMGPATIALLASVQPDLLGRAAGV